MELVFLHYMVEFHRAHRQAWMAQRASISRPSPSSVSLPKCNQTRSPSWKFPDSTVCDVCRGALCIFVEPFAAAAPLHDVSS